MERMHGELNAEGLKYQEPYPYHPHITLAQDLKSDEVDELARVARTRWAESTVPKTFRVEQVFFVQNTRRKQWLRLPALPWHSTLCRMRVTCFPIS